MTFDRLTWIGLMLVALGWALLLSGTPAIEAVLHFLHREGTLNPTVISQSTILTGFGLAILGALQTGFSSLKHFFDSVLARTAHNAPKVTIDAPKAKQRSVVERGLLRDRPYILFGDGTIEVETLLGMRRFTSLQEAYEFIGH